MSRTKAKNNLTMEEFKEKMTNVWSSCISKGTLDESPMAYKNINYLVEAIGETVEILDHWKEIYNFKSSEG